MTELTPAPNPFPFPLGTPKACTLSDNGGPANPTSRISWPGRVISPRGIISVCRLSMLSGVTMICMGLGLSEYLEDKEGVLQGCSSARN
ncbi:hypothetical protein K443DRAFT_684655 [Laccaria amethystina LaAM-08-1]|jgi:hypothetical protein|uniref:Uncharacterized protein n=1 Tax=Laccaria amethystina LaAM-08-1 TaxID=1095629 RepID=A0A0C9WWJ7_9AGAR|nr:hypothetical protein K443DRAFT_684655 [Laccaria amethystina LaAM-08-1]